MTIVDEVPGTLYLHLYLYLHDQDYSTDTIELLCHLRLNEAGDAVQPKIDRSWVDSNRDPN